jgi:hypothetical protein
VKECIAGPVSYHRDCENRDAAKYMAMADLDRMECVPISFVLYPRVSLPMKQTWFWDNWWSSWMSLVLVSLGRSCMYWQTSKDLCRVMTEFISPSLPSTWWGRAHVQRSDAVWQWHLVCHSFGRWMWWRQCQLGIGHNGNWGFLIPLRRSKDSQGTKVWRDALQRRMHLHPVDHMLCHPVWSLNVEFCEWLVDWLHSGASCLGLCWRILLNLNVVWMQGSCQCCRGLG